MLESIKRSHAFRRLLSTALVLALLCLLLPGCSSGENTPLTETVFPTVSSSADVSSTPENTALLSSLTPENTSSTTQTTDKEVSDTPALTDYTVTTSAPPSQPISTPEPTTPIPATSAPTTPPPTPEPTQAQTCQLLISCATILDNIEDLAPGKENYIPEGGIIFPQSTVEFTEGDSIIDIVINTCNDANIQIDYEYSPIYDSYYIQGINYIYEKDCGSMSGWIIKLNGEPINSSANTVFPENGDIIEILYTCAFGSDLD